MAAAHRTTPLMFRMPSPRPLFAAVLVWSLVVALGSAQTLLEVQPIPVSALPALAPVAGQPIVVKDLDGDGDDDLVACENTLLVVLRQQAGVFTREVVAASMTTLFLAAEDFDRDGNVDLLFGPFTSFPANVWVTIQWGDGTGHFPTAQTSSVFVPSNYTNGQLAAADVDQDNDLDVVMTAPTGAVGGILVRNNGNRTFTVAPAAQFPSLASGNAKPWFVDVDGDGASDVVLVSRDATTRLYWNNGGSFVAATTGEFPLPQTSLRELVCVDVDGDGDRDLALGGDTGPGVLLRTNAPRQLVLDPMPFGPARVLALHVIDADGDADPDVHVFSRDRDELWSNDGIGGFTFARWYGGTEGVHTVVRADMDADGDPDFLRIGNRFGVSGPIQTTLTAAWTVAGGKLEYDGVSRLPVSAYAVGNGGDIDGDGLLDVLVGNNEPSGSTIQFAPSDGRGVFAFRWAQRVGGFANGFFADLTGDGRDEYVFTVVPTAYLANTDGVLAATATPLPVPTFGSIPVGAGADIDGDSDQDLILVRSLGTNCLLCVLINNGTAFTDESATRLVGPPITGPAPAVRVGDFDQDGDVDVWLHTSSEEQIWRNQNGVLTFVPNAIPITGYWPDAGNVADLDGDGDLDLHSARRFLFNNGNGTFVPDSQRTPNTLENTSLTFSADLDDDGDLDLIGQGTAVWNDGNAFFTQAPNPMPFAFGSGNGLRHVVDLDRDGDPDAIATIANRPVVLLNQLRQFELQGLARIGGSIALHYRTRPGQAALPVAVWYLFSLGEVPATSFPEFGWLRIDLAQSFFVGPSLLPATGGDVTQQLSLPVDPALIGLFFSAQPLELRGARLRLGGFVSSWIRQ